MELGGGVDVRPELALTAPRRDQPRDMMDGDEEHGSGSGGISPADVGMDELDDSTGGIEDGDVGLVSGGCCGERAQFRV